MKTSLTFAHVLLAVGPAIAGVVSVAVNGILPGSPPEAAPALRVRDDIVERTVKLSVKGNRILGMLM